MDKMPVAIHKTSHALMCELTSESSGKESVMATIIPGEGFLGLHKSTPFRAGFDPSCSDLDGNLRKINSRICVMLLAELPMLSPAAENSATRERKANTNQAIDMALRLASDSNAGPLLTHA